MARDQKTDQKRPEQQAQDTDAPIVTAPAGPQYVQSGAIPPVETAAAKPAPSASDRAFGKGVQALEAMISKGAPKASEVASLIDAHRDEHDQMLSLVQQKLGDAFAATVRADLSSLRASIANKEVVAGDPGDPNADYLDISQAQGGAKFKAAGGKVTGTADKNGLDTTAKLNAHDSIHAQVKPDKSGTVDWNRDGKTEAELAGHYKDGKNYDASLTSTQNVGGGSLTEDIKHEVTDGKTSDTASADFKKGDTTAHADAGVVDGKFAGHLSGSTKTAHDTISGSVGHDANGTSAQIKDTHDFGGGKTGTLDATYNNGTIAETGTLKTKTDELTETVSHDKTGTSAEVKDTHDFGGGKTGTLDATYNNGTIAETGTLKTKTDDFSETVSHDKTGTSAEVKDTHDFGGGKTGSLDLKRAANGALSETGTLKTKTDDFSETVSHDKTGTSAEVKDTHDFGNGKTGSLDATYKNGTIAETGTLKTKTDELTETVSHDKTGTSAEVKDTHDFGGGKTGSLDLTRAANGALSETGTYKSKTDDFSEVLSHDKNGTAAELKDTHTFGDSSIASFDLTRAGNGAFSETGTYKSKTDDFSEVLSHDKNGTAAEVKDTHDFGHGTTGAFDFKREATGALSESGTLTHKGAHDQETATIAHDAKGTTGSLTGSYENGNTKLDGSVARTNDAWKLHAGATEKVNPALTLSGKLDETVPDHGKAQTDFSLSEKYGTGKVIQGLDLEGGRGSHDYLKATGSVDAQLAPNLYGSAWGSYSYEAGHQDTAQLGASLTFTHDEKQALTLAGVMDQHGRFETRLQFDVFKDRINSVSALEQHKKDAMVSLFLSYSQQVGGHRALDDRFGAPQIETPGNASQVMAGIRIRF